MVCGIAVVVKQHTDTVSDAMNIIVRDIEITKLPPSLFESCANFALFLPPYFRATISFLISPIAWPGLRCLGQVAVQFMIVWQR